MLVHGTGSQRETQWPGALAAAVLAAQISASRGYVSCGVISNSWGHIHVRRNDNRTLD